MTVKNEEGEAMAKFDRKMAHIRLFELTVCAMMGAIAFALKVAMANLPNIEPVTMLLMLCTLIFGYKAFLSCSVYVLLEGIFFGISTWWVPYLYAWPILILITLPLRRFRNPFLFSAVATVYGFLFGFFFLPVNYFVYNMQGRPDLVIAYIVQDFEFNLYHAIGNAVIVTLLLPPLRIAMEKAVQRVRKGMKV